MLRQNCKLIILFSLVILIRQDVRALHYGRIYNVEDFIRSSGSDLDGINRCLSTAYHRMYQESIDRGIESKHEIVYTIIFPCRTYKVNGVMSPITIKNGRKEYTFSRSMEKNSYKRVVKFNIIGLSASNLEFKSALVKAGISSSNTQNYTGYDNNELSQYYWLSKDYLKNGLDISENKEANKVISQYSARTNIVCNNKPATVNFLVYKPTSYPTIISTNTLSHSFFYLKSEGVGLTEAWVYPPAKNKLMPETHLNISGIRLCGKSSLTNSHIYNVNSEQHDKAFAMGTCIFLEAIKNVSVTNIILENVYGNGIMVHNRFYAYINGQCIVDSNVILNVWGLKYRLKCADRSYDDTGYAISFSGIESGQSNYNLIRNDLSVTKQYGSIGQASCCENNRNCEAAYNSIHGYDRGIHIENGLGGFKIHHNRVTGSETALVLDGNRDYKNSNCPDPNPCIIEFNYFSNEDLTFNSNLQKIYPQHLLFSPSAHRSNEYRGSIIRNNYFKIDKKLLYNYTKNNSSECQSKDPRGYNFADEIERFHIKSGIRQQNIINNTFEVVNSTILKAYEVGGTFLNSYCPDEIIDPNPCPVVKGDFDCGWINNSTNNKNLYRSTLPLSLIGNKYINCETLYIMHYTSSIPNIYGNIFNNRPRKILSIGLEEYTKKVK